MADDDRSWRPDRLCRALLADRPRHWGGHQVLGARDIGFAAGAGQQSVVADAMKPLRQNVNSSALSVTNARPQPQTRFQSLPV
jgi:hypothetical protein